MFDEIELGMLAESFGEFLRREWPRSTAIAFQQSGRLFADDLWKAMARLGWPALSAPETVGGLALGAVGAVHLCSALGAAAAPAPMIGSLLAPILLRADIDGDLLSGIVDGSMRVAIADPCAAPLSTDGKTVVGIASNVLDAASANIFMFRALRNSDPCWIAVDAETAGMSLERHPLADVTRTLGTVTLRNVRIGENRLIHHDEPHQLDNQVTRHACVALAADSLGAGDAVLAMTIEYMKERVQFGRAIGSFQALKHRVADHKTALVGARELVLHAASVPDNAKGALLAALSVKQHVTHIVAEIARDCVQLHGGVGFTTEFAPHLYLKRAKLNEALFGTRAVLLDRIANLLEAA